MAIFRICNLSGSLLMTIGPPSFENRLLKYPSTSVSPINLRVITSQEATSNGENSVNISKPAGTSVDDLLIFSCMYGPQSGSWSSVTDLGWTIAHQIQPDPEIGFFVAYKPVDSTTVSSASFTFTLDSPVTLLCGNLTLLRDALNTDPIYYSSSSLEKSVALNDFQIPTPTFTVPAGGLELSFGLFAINATSQNDSTISYSSASVPVYPFALAEDDIVGVYFNEALTTSSFLYYSVAKKHQQASGDLYRTVAAYNEGGVYQQIRVTTIVIKENT